MEEILIKSYKLCKPIFKPLCITLCKTLWDHLRCSEPCEGICIPDSVSSNQRLGYDLLETNIGSQYLIRGFSEL